MKLTVLSVAYPFAPVGPDSVGGAEQILACLDEYLTDQDHHSIVIACEGSTPKGTLVAIPKTHGSLTDTARRSAQQECRIAISEVLRRYPVDVVHMHGFDFHSYLPRPGVPVIATLHLPLEWYPPGIFRIERSRTYFRCVSSAEQRSCPSGKLLPAIQNGIRVERFAARVRKYRFALALGRICPEKGFHLALDAAKNANIPMLLAGEVFRYDAHERYYREEIVPRLSSSRKFAGPVSFRRKRRLLAGAHCLLAPSLAPETSSLVGMEALASGTPVIAFPNGALADLIDDGKTGFLVSNEREMAMAISKAGSIDSETCRTAARERFSAEAMSQQYLALYERLADEARSSQEDPPQALLEGSLPCGDFLGRCPT